MPRRSNAPHDHYVIVNRYPGPCGRCCKIVASAGGWARSEGFWPNGRTRWVVYHNACYPELASMTDEAVILSRREAHEAQRRNAQARRQQERKEAFREADEYRNTRHFSDDASISDPLPIATNRADLAFHRACVEMLALDFRVRN